MGNDEAAVPTKSDKASLPAEEARTIHPYPDWAATQAYYGPGLTVPPYLTAAVAPGHIPHPYNWGSQPFMPPYGTPYTAIYAHGVYAPPPVPQGSQPQCQGFTISPSANEAVVIATPLNIEPPVASPGDNASVLLKKLKGIDGLPVSNDNGNDANTLGGATLGMSQGRVSGTEGSSEGSDENNESGEDKNQIRESSEETFISGKNVKAVRPSSVIHGGETNESSKKPSLSTANITRKPVGSVCSSSPMLANEVKASVPSVPTSLSTSTPGRDGLPIEQWIQDERALKRERRKQSNRESARRSRLRKQVETEDLAVKVQALGAENMTLRTEIIRLKENSEKLRNENSALAEKLEDIKLCKVEDKFPENERLPVTTFNFLSKVNNPSTFASEESENGTRKSTHGKLHQLFGSSSQPDAMAAG